jgi:hypothetical protein
MTERCQFRSRSAGTVAAMAVALFGVACGQDRLPSGVTRAGLPATVPGPPPPPTPQPGPSTAVIAATTFTAREVQGVGGFGYALKVIISETGGKSGAYVSTPVIILPNGDRNLGCLQGTIYIEPRGSWDMDTLGYCAPEAYSPQKIDALSVSVTFIDDEGHSGTLTATAAVTR